MEFFLFFVGFLLIVAVIFLTAEVRRLGTRLKQEQTGTERSFAAIELAFEEMMEQLERRGKELMGELNAARELDDPERQADGRGGRNVAVAFGAAAAPSIAPAPLTPHPTAPAGTSDGESDGTKPEVAEAGAETKGDVRALLRLKNAEPPAPPPRRAGEPAPNELPERALQARNLVEEGLSTVEIARTLGVGRGDVQLLLALERSRRGGGGGDPGQSHP